MRARTDIVSGIALAVLSLVLVFWIIPANTSPPHSAGNLSPAFLPTLSALVVLALSGLLAAVTWFGERGEPAPHEEFGEEARGIGLAELADIAIWAAFAAAMMTGFLVAGFLPTAIAGLALMMLYAGVRNWLALALVAVALPVAIQQIAWHAFTVQLP